MVNKTLLYKNEYKDVEEGFFKSFKQFIVIHKIALTLKQDISLYLYIH